MARTLSFLALALLVSLSSFAEDRSQWKTSSDVTEGVVGSVVGTVTDIQSANRFVVAPDDDKYSTILVDTDALSTRWNGFGGTINGSPEIFVGSAGFPNLRTADRVEVRGVGRGVGNVRANSITLLGRPVEAPQTGIGQTRDPGNISTPTASATTPATAPERLGRIEGVVRSVNAAEGRVVIETDNRALMTIRAGTSTPVRYKGDTYRIANLEQGDRIRVDPESAATTGGEIRARSIDVLQSVQQSGGNSTRGIGNLTLIPMDDSLAQEVAELAADYALRGADATYVAVARRHNCTLVSLDREQRERSAAIVATHTPAEALVQLQPPP